MIRELESNPSPAKILLFSWKKVLYYTEKKVAYYKYNTCNYAFWKIFRGRICECEKKVRNYEIFSFHLFIFAHWFLVVGQLLYEQNHDSLRAIHHSCANLKEQIIIDRASITLRRMYHIYILGVLFFCYINCGLGLMCWITDHFIRYLL